MANILLQSDDPSLAEARIVPVIPISAKDWPDYAAAQAPRVSASADITGFRGNAGELLLVPTAEGLVDRVLFGLGEAARVATAFRALSGGLPSGLYRIDGLAGSASFAEQVALAWIQGTYRFDRYKSDRARPPPQLVVSAGVDVARVAAMADACALARDLVNTPANDMGPGELEICAREVALAHGGTLTVTAGDDLIAAGYPAIHAVGRAAGPHRAARMIEMSWGEAGGPLVAIVGKGVAFDTGGLDIKPSSSMRLMKKDMGGAAHALALAKMVMAANLPVRLALLIPAVENAISGDAMRPGDVLASRKGVSIEVGNTDAEGRLVLADALARAAELEPDLTIDLATLTGAARAALGPQIVPFYTADDALALALSEASSAVDDPLWRMPLWRDYAPALDSEVADIKNDPDGWAQAGSVTAALFLQRFAPAGAWVHFDIFAWNPRGRPGRPVGAEVQAIRAILAMLAARYR
jgi:leucyl aminopeptidase